MTAELLQRFANFWSRDTGLVLLDLVDIAIVAVLIYRVLSVIRGTRAMQTGIGLALVFLIHHGARRLGLTTLWTILDTLLTYIVLIVVIIFQNDIRRALTRVGRPQLFGSRQSSITRHMVEEVVKATTLLTTRRVGALIVFERDAMLDKFVEPGVEIDAGVSKELLYSVFVPSYENPMHDGAVLLREGRIWQAGVVLPLSTSPRLDRTLGTRHRAGIGITEETDAVAVVVSEERGSTSLCFGGNMVRNLDAKSLREALMGLFSPRTTTVRKGEKVASTRKSAPSNATDAPASKDSSGDSAQETHTTPDDTVSSSSSKATPLNAEKSVKTTPLELSFTDESVPLDAKVESEPPKPDSSSASTEGDNAAQNAQGAAPATSVPAPSTPTSSSAGSTGSTGKS